MVEIGFVELLALLSSTGTAAALVYHAGKLVGRVENLEKELAAVKEQLATVNENAYFFKAEQWEKTRSGKNKNR